MTEDSVYSHHIHFPSHISSTCVYVLPFITSSFLHHNLSHISSICSPQRFPSLSSLLQGSVHIKATSLLGNGHEQTTTNLTGKQKTKIVIPLHPKPSTERDARRSPPRSPHPVSVLYAGTGDLSPSVPARRVAASTTSRRRLGTHAATLPPGEGRVASLGRGDEEVVVMVEAVVRVVEVKY